MMVISDGAPVDDSPSRQIAAIIWKNICAMLLA